ncbi:MAG: hypothetical protein QNI99_09295 [Woeseiaceae bacterium]|nr:hypothetical protein [Woeseiaceae bacterium]
MQPEQPEEPRVPVPTHLALLAWALILGGASVAIYVLTELFRTYRDVDGNSFVGQLAERFSDSTVMTFGELPLTLTEQGATIMAYFVFIPLALLAIHIAAALIRAGSHILSPAFPYQIARLKQRINRLSDKMDDQSGN